MDNRVDVFDIGNLYNFMPAYELGYYKEPGAKFIKTLTNRQLTTLKSCFIIHFTSFNDFRVELIEQYKAFLENKDTYIT